VTKVRKKKDNGKEVQIKNIQGKEVRWYRKSTEGENLTKAAFR